MLRSLIRPSLRSYARYYSASTADVTGPWNFLEGSRCDPRKSSETEEIDIFHPASGERLVTMMTSDASTVDAAVTSARQAFTTWGQTSGKERGALLMEAARRIRAAREDIAYYETLDTGKPLWEARLDVDGCVDSLEFYAGVAPTLSGQHITLPQGSFAYTRREPLGVVGAMGAWNYPFQMATWKSAPALACGNTIVFKPSPLTPMTAVMLGELYAEAGIPAGCFSVVQGDVATGKALSSHPDVDKMSFTGSVAVGSQIMATCAKDIKSVTLELGGKSPLIIFEDADIDEAVKGAMMANFLTQGQVCSNGTRVYVHESVMESFLSRLVPLVARQTVGDPFHDDTKIGAVISPAQAEKILGFVGRARAEGAKVLTGGERVTPKDSKLAGGNFMSPCVLTNLTDDMEVVREEVFGPVMSVLRFTDENDVIARANDTVYGLAGGVFTKDLGRAHRVAAKLETGNVYINNYNVYPAEIPFGGFKKSGIGKENGLITIEYYSQLKTVYVEGDKVWCPYE